MDFKAAAIFSLLVVAASPFPQQYPQDPVQYSFIWAVQHPASGNNYGHQETRSGDETKGSYFVDLPDGRMQKVTYFVSGKSGFVAEVTYVGKAVFPEPKTYEQQFQSASVSIL